MNSEMPPWFTLVGLAVFAVVALGGLAIFVDRDNLAAEVAAANERYQNQLKAQKEEREQDRPAWKLACARGVLVLQSETVGLCRWNIFNFSYFFSKDRVRVLAARKLESLRSVCTDVIELPDETVVQAWCNERTVLSYTGSDLIDSRAAAAEPSTAGSEEFAAAPAVPQDEVPGEDATVNTDLSQGTESPPPTEEPGDPAAPDLSGRWTGHYELSESGDQPVAFAVELSGAQGKFRGRITELTSTSDGAGQSSVEAEIELQVDAQGYVKFKKTYATDHVIFYGGWLAPSGQTMEGSWSYNEGGRDGTFRAERAPTD